ncbi:protoglobin domain-containing protein [Azospirillum thermophilum]|nr:protoglobin domain-containing protein [Azospirillum thermophilum]
MWTQTSAPWGAILDYLEIDEDTAALVRSSKAAIMPVLADILDEFYRRTPQRPELAPLFARASTVDAVKAAQIRHWDLLFDGAFDGSYRASVVRIGTAHQAIDLPIEWYVSSHAFVLGELLDRVIRGDARVFQTKTRRTERARLVKALTGSALLDMAFAIAAHTGEAVRGQRAEAERMVENIDRQVADTVDTVTAFTAALADSARSMTDAAAAVDRDTDAAAAAANSVLASAQTVAAAAEELHASIAEISVQVGGAASTSREAVARMRGRGTSSGGWGRPPRRSDRSCRSSAPSPRRPTFWR